MKEKFLKAVQKLKPYNKAMFEAAGLDVRLNYTGVKKLQQV